MDGEIYIARGDGKGSDGINTYEMVHLRPLPNMDPSQPTSYIIEPVQCAVSGSATSYVLHQAPQEQGASKLVKAPACSGPVRQVMQTHGSESSQVSPVNLLKPVSRPPANFKAAVFRLSIMSGINFAICIFRALFHPGLCCS